MKLFAYKNGSASAKLLAEALGIKKLKHEGKKIHVRGTLINWGSSSFKGRAITADDYLNLPEAVRLAANKLNTFEALKRHEVKSPEWTVDREEARQWLQIGFDVVVRHTVTGHSGEGIEIIKSLGRAKMDAEYAVPKAPLYTKYVKKDQEYRIHVFNGQIIFEQRKARKKDVADEDVNWQIRNHANGFIFAHKDLEVPVNVKEEAVKAVVALNLDFGAVDIMTDKRGEAYVLEVNTACGLEGETLTRYVEAFKQFQ